MQRDRTDTDSTCSQPLRPSHPSHPLHSCIPCIDQPAGAIHSFRESRATVILPFDEAGTGRPIVLLHARPTNRSMWRAHLPLLARAGVRAIALDLPGHGDAVLPRRHETTPWTDVLDTLDHLGVDRFVLAGNSLGALVALQVAVTEPQRVQGLVAVGYRPHDMKPSSRLRTAWDEERVALEADDIEAAVRAGVEAWISPKASEDVRAQAAVMMRGQLVARVAYGEPKAAADPLGEDPGALRALTVPALVGVGAFDMPDFFEGGARLSDELKAGEVAVLADAGHLAPLEQPAAFCALLLDFVDRLPAQSSERPPGTDRRVAGSGGSRQADLEPVDRDADRQRTPSGLHDGAGRPGLRLR
ncbi:alpha/beta fold hydrolase [Streptomyces sp. FR-108]|uniref:alpha/beta fold hydrolase n=1 Tax=Streptomyces sp. FR-108 TaxID=3416665 RepID=UPI003CE8F37A